MTERISRTAGLGGVLAFAAWLLQPLLVFALIGDEERLSWASLEATGWSAPYEVVTFVLVAVGLFLLVHGIDRQCRADERASPLATGGHLAGYASVLAWLSVAAGQGAPFTTASSDLEAMSAADQGAALAIYGVVQMSALLLAVLCGAGWLTMVGTHARARGVVGRPTAYAALAAALVAVAPFMVPFSAPWGTLAVFVMALWLGVHQLLASRGARATVPQPA